VLVGAPPAPPPITTPWIARAALDAHALLLLKYGTPPLVPATVKAGVVVGFAIEIMPPVNPTEVTVPLPPPPEIRTLLAAVMRPLAFTVNTPT
jgi:hypothetical protein